MAVQRRSMRVVCYVLASLCLCYCFFFKSSRAYAIDLAPYFIKTEQQAVDLISKTKSDIEEILSELEGCQQEHLDFNYFFGKLDAMCELNSIANDMLEAYLYVGTDELLASKIRGMTREFAAWSLKRLAMNTALYEMAKRCFENAQNLSPEEIYHAQNVIDAFEKAGVGLMGSDRERFAALQDEIIGFCLQYENNIQACQDGIWVTREQLEGLSENVIKTLKFDEAQNTYFLGVDYPTSGAVIRDCRVATTRHELRRKFIQRAYPENLPILEKIRSLRHEYANLLGYKTKADLDCDKTMAGSVASAEELLALVDTATRQAALQSRESFFASLDSDIKSCFLHPEGELVHSDVGFAVNQLEKKLYNIDQEKISEYFPVKHTVQKLLDIYSNFFGITFKQRAPESWWWVDNLVVLDVFENETFLGSIVLDLYPRKNKFTHACSAGLQPAHHRNGVRVPSVSLVIANFSPATADHDGLLKHGEVTTFFHEFGHALHRIFGSTRFSGASGTSVKMDFVETPSQMFEEWMWKPKIIKSISRHYATGEQLDDSTIEQLCASRNYLEALFYFQVQLMYARYSLNIFRSDIDAVTLKNQECERIIRLLPVNPEDHFECSFGHLIGYGARYYSYLWSLVYALDLFDYIEKQGLDNPEVGKRFRKEILEPGGSRDPRELVRAFLGRDVSYEPLMRFVSNT